MVAEGMDFLKKLRRFDAYPKTLEDVRIQTLGGGTISIISMLIISLLFWLELLNYLTPNVTEELFVDTSRSPNIEIQFDLIVPRVACDFLALDAMDSSGDQHLQVGVCNLTIHISLVNIISIHENKIKAFASTLT